MPAGQVFLVTKLGPVKEKSKADYYTGTHESDKVWQVGMVSGNFPGFGISFYFADRAQAERFSLWEVVNLKNVLDNAGATNMPFYAESIVKSSYPFPGTYTNTPILRDVWITTLTDPVTKRKLAMRFPNQGDAHKYSIGKPYTLQNIFGTMPSVAADVAANL